MSERRVDIQGYAQAWQAENGRRADEQHAAVQADARRVLQELHERHRSAWKGSDTAAPRLQPESPTFEADAAKALAELERARREAWRGR